MSIPNSSRTAPRHALLTLALLNAAACSRAAPPLVSAPAPAARMVAVELGARVYRSDAGGVSDSVRMVVRDAAAWTALWRRVTANESSPPTMPEVDFTRDMLLVAGAGRMSPGDEIRVDSVSVQDRTLFVIVRTRVECRPFPGSSFPLEIVKVRRYDERVVFTERRDKSECH